MSRELYNRIEYDAQQLVRSMKYFEQSKDEIKRVVFVSNLLLQTIVKVDILEALLYTEPDNASSVQMELKGMLEIESVASELFYEYYSKYWNNGSTGKPYFSKDIEEDNE